MKEKIEIITSLIAVILASILIITSAIYHIYGDFNNSVYYGIAAIFCALAYINGKIK